jgi:hypothetical protein
MDMKIYGLPGSVVVIALVYAVGLAIAPAPGLSAQTAGTSASEAEPDHVATGVAKPMPAMLEIDEQSGYLGAHLTLAPDRTNCANLPDAALKREAILHAHYRQPPSGTVAQEPATGPVHPGKLTFF